MGSSLKFQSYNLMALSYTTPNHSWAYHLEVNIHALWEQESPYTATTSKATVQMVTYTCSVSNSWVDTNAANNQYGQFTIDRLDVQARYNGPWNWHFISINTGTAYNAPRLSTDPSTSVVVIEFNSGQTYSQLYSSAQQYCSIESGVIGNDMLNPVSCSVDTSNNRMVIKHVYAFTNTPLKVYYYALTASSQSNYVVTVKLFNDVNAFNDYNWVAFYSTTTPGYTLVNMFYVSFSTGGYSTNDSPDDAQEYPGTGNGGYTNMFSSGNVDTAGYARVNALTNTSIQVQLSKGSTLSSGSYNTYRTTFRFYVERLTPVGGCTGSSIWSNWYGTLNFFSSVTCSITTSGGEDRYFYVSYYYYTTSNQHWPTWNAG
ncbi:unnamed protein product [Sphagnum balticum]